MNPVKKQRCGYLVAFNGLGLTTEPSKTEDPYKIRVFTPFNTGDTKPEYTQAEPDVVNGQNVLNCIGIIESFSFGGGVGDSIHISAYVSTEFASQLKAKQKATLATTVVTKLGWWIVNYDVEAKAWFEEAFPMGNTEAKDGLVKGQLNASGGKDIKLAIADSPTLISPNIDVQVFNMYFEIVPASDTTYALTFRQGKNKPQVLGWGLQVGNIAKQKMTGS